MRVDGKIAAVEGTCLRYGISLGGLLLVQKGWRSVIFLGRSISDPAEEVFMCLLDFVIASDSVLFAGDMAGSVRFWLCMEE